MENQTVVKLCGQYPENFVKQEIATNPNFIFENDPNFVAVGLYDSDQNTVFVNSFIECEHYVTGGWDQNPLQKKEANLQSFIVVAVLLFFIIKFLNSRFNFSLFGK
tara:strand:+ start:228 stop:545 length:318 start_codon:yes stop_codon:yes gene_type:complete